MGGAASNVTCCVPWPIAGNETAAGCEAGGAAKHDGGTYRWNADRGRHAAVCGEQADCDCCRIGPPSPGACDPPSPAPSIDTNTRIFHPGGSPSLSYVPPGARGAHPTNGTLLAFGGATRLRRSSDHGACACVCFHVLVSLSVSLSV